MLPESMPPPLPGEKVEEKYYCPPEQRKASDQFYRNKHREEIRERDRRRRLDPNIHAKEKLAGKRSREKLKKDPAGHERRKKKNKESAARRRREKNNRAAAANLAKRWVELDRWHEGKRGPYLCELVEKDVRYQ